MSRPRTSPRRAARLKGGPVRAGRAAGIALRRGHALTEAAIDRLFEIAEILSEGGMRPADGAYFGSTMLTVDLDDLAIGWRGELDENRARSTFLAVVEGSFRFRLRLLRLARTEMLRRVQGAEIGTMVAETRFRIRSGKLHADVDLEAPIDVDSARRQRQG